MESRPDGRRHPGASPALRGWPGGGGSSAVARRLPPVLTAPLITTLALHRIFQNETFAIRVIRPWLSEGMGWGQLLRRKPPSTSPVPHAPCPPLPAPQLWTDRSGAAGRAAGTMAPAPSSCVTGRAPSSESQVRRSFRTAGSLQPFSCQPWAPAPGTKGLAGPGDSLHLRGVILGPETLVSTRAFCKFASLPPRRCLDPVLGLRVVPLCLSSLRF